MKTASPALVALLAASSGQFLMADLYTFTLRSGMVLRYTSGDLNLTVGGETFIANGPLVQGGNMRLVRGLEVGTCDITIVPGPGDTVAGQPLLQAIARGAFDRATVLRQRVFMPSWGDTSGGAVTMFLGECADIEPSRHQAVLHVKSMLHLLDIAMPRRLFQPHCPWVFGDSNCTVDRASYAVSGAAVAGSTAVLVKSALAQAAAYFDQGTLAFTSGANAGVSRTVKSFSGGSFQLVAPFPAVPAAGDAFTATPGCDHTLPTFATTVELRSIPGAPYQIGPANYATFDADYGVTLLGATTQPPGYYDEWGSWILPPPVTGPDVAMVKVGGTPGPGQYTQNGSPVYTFAAADSGRQVRISYSYATSNLTATCWARYHNVIHFGGQPFVPVPETAI